MTTNETNAANETDILGCLTGKMLRLSFTYSSFVYSGAEILSSLLRKIDRSFYTHTQKMQLIYYRLLKFLKYTSQRKYNCGEKHTLFEYGI